MPTNEKEMPAVPDLSAIIEEGKTYEQLIDHTVDVDFRGHTIRVLDIEMMIELKKASKDPKDLQRIPILEETLRQLKNMKKDNLR